MQSRNARPQRIINFVMFFVAALKAISKLKAGLPSLRASRSEKFLKTEDCTCSLRLKHQVSIKRTMAGRYCL